MASAPSRRTRSGLRARVVPGRRRGAGGGRLALVLAVVAGLIAAPAGPGWARPGLETTIQDDVSFQGRPPAQVVQAMAQVRALGINQVRLTASWSNLAPSPESPSRPAFNATDPGAYEQSRWKELDFAVRAAHAAGLQVMIDVGAWAPRWATQGPEPRARQDINADDFAQFAEAVARRYSGSFTPAGAPASDPSISAPANQVPSSSAGGAGQGSGTPTGPLPGIAPGSPGPAPTPPAAPTPPSPALRPAGTRLPAARGAGSRQSPSGSAAAPAPNGGTPLPSVTIFTLWNEPNHPAFLLPQWKSQGRRRVPASPAEYRRMVIAGYGAIKQAQPGATILIGNTSSFGGHGSRDPVAPLAFLRELACVNGHLRPLRTPDCHGFRTIPGDGWAHHPYSLTGTPAKKGEPGHRDDIYMANLGRLARVLDRLVAKGRLAPGLRSLYVTEYGYETHSLLDRPALAQNKQALYLTWGEYLASKIPNVKLFGQFLLRDQPPAATVVSDSLRRPNGQFYSGLEDAAGAPKLAMRSFVAGLFATRGTQRTTLLWGRFRLGSQRLEVVVDHRSHHGPWRLVPTSPRPGGRAVRSFNVDGQDSFLRYGPAARGQYRLRYRSPGGTWTTGLPVPFVPRPG